MNYYIPQWKSARRTASAASTPTPSCSRTDHLPGTPISDDVANAVIAQLLCLQSMNPDQDISIYINSPGGSFTALTAIYDTMKFIKPDVQTVCIGPPAAAILLAAGTPGQAAGTAQQPILIHQPHTEGTFGQTSDIEIQANEILRMRELLEKMISDHSGRSIEEVSRDIERDKILTAEGAVEYGLIDAVLESPRDPRPSPERSRDRGGPTRPVPTPVAAARSSCLCTRGGRHGVPSDELTPLLDPAAVPESEDDHPWHVSVTEATC